MNIAKWVTVIQRFRRQILFNIKSINKVTRRSQRYLCIKRASSGPDYCSAFAVIGVSEIMESIVTNKLLIYTVTNYCCY